MSVRIRLTRVGSNKNPFWRVVVTDQRSPRDGRFIEMIGHYNPQVEPSEIVLDRERLDHWLSRGAQPTNTVKKLMRAETGAPAAAAETPAPDAPDPGGAGGAKPEERPQPQEQPDPDAQPEAEPEPTSS